ncbi:hypothetical protein VTK73DRAFT_956 [Phialemonium thermophilum]|uniref:C2H2-type domain-containing protein n=1 Tax=Phialemonium thermophilum TaxID=223376 RepID=A0ABR3XC00_9PEZI
MASSKEIQQTSRPLPHRPSANANPIAGSLGTIRQSHSRANSHSILSSSLNANHRVTRRKSMTNTAANVAAVAAALHEAGDKAMPLPISMTSRRHTISRNGLSRSAIANGLPSPPASLPTSKFVEGGQSGANMGDSAIDDDPNDMSTDEGDLALQKARIRRASDGQPLGKEGRKNRPELRCEKCGKGYKHSSCLTKHLWEHTPEWNLTSKLLISKHQQVQLLEAASVLVAMNNSVSDSTTTPPDSAGDVNSDRDSASPAASGDSDLPDGSSADTTPPPQPDRSAYGLSSDYHSTAKRRSSGAGFGLSYRSTYSASSTATSMPVGSGFGHFRQRSQDLRPVSSGRNATGQDDSELAAAVELLSCSLNSNGGSRAVHLPVDVPPVPPLPVQYLDASALTGTSFINSFPNKAPESFTRGELSRESVKRGGSMDSAIDYDDDDMQSRARSDEDDDGVFGRMEE